MNNHDALKKSGNIELSEVLKKVAPDFGELSLDIKEIGKYSNDPMFISLLLFKLTKEREKTNKILINLEDKYDKVMLMLKTQSHLGVQTPTKKEFEMLSEQDEKIMQLAESMGQITCNDVQKELNYKAQNGASQRLNKLFKEGHLRKIKSGRKVFFIPHTTPNSQHEQTINP